MTDTSPATSASPASPTAGAAAGPSGVAGAGPVRLADLTTLRVGGPVTDHVVARSTDAVIDAVSSADAAGRPLLVLGGGSNVLAGDGPFDGTVVQVATRGMVVEADDTCGGVCVRVAAGEPWDDFVAAAVREGWSGVEALSGVPGSTGATPVQNVGAYGQEIAHTLARVRVWDRQESRVRTFANADCEFGYRRSLLKDEQLRGSPRFIVLEVTFLLRDANLSAPVRYAELARILGVEQGERAPLEQVRRAVLGLRAGKGMVLDDADHDTWSAGSFFTNPVLTAGEADGLPEGAPRYPIGDGQVKTSAAWLIEN
ncbi:MAG: UDP-N-acetylmuramate dehydrogenase, partial [Kineosporiaceae bacterium]